MDSQVCLGILAKGLTSSRKMKSVLHQANAFMLNSIRKKLKIDQNHFFIDLLDGGNTVSSTIPIALKKYSQFNTGITQNIILVGFGVGLSWSGGLIKINKKL